MENTNVNIDYINSMVEELQKKMDKVNNEHTVDEYRDLGNSLIIAHEENNNDELVMRQKFEDIYHDIISISIDMKRTAQVIIQRLESVDNPSAQNLAKTFRKSILASINSDSRMIESLHIAVLRALRLPPEDEVK